MLHSARFQNAYFLARLDTSVYAHRDIAHVDASIDQGKLVVIIDLGAFMVERLVGGTQIADMQRRQFCCLNHALAHKAAGAHGLLTMAG